MLTIGKYTTEELLKILNISEATWKRRKNEFLEHFHYYFDYTVINEGRSTCYLITEVFGEYEPLPRKKTREEKVNFYKEQTHNIVEYDPWNTGSNIAEIIIKRENRYNHAVGTAANYVRPILKEDYQISQEKQWMQKDYDRYIYIPLEEEQVEYLQELFKKFRCNNSDVIAEYKSGYLNKDEAKDQIFNNEEKNYDQVMQAFVNKYGFRPIKVGKYEPKPF